MSEKRHRPSPALIVALIALVAALAGTATALPGKGSVDKNDIKKNAVKSKAIKNKAVKKADLKPGSVDGSRIADASVGAADLAPQEPFRKVGDPGQPAFFDGGEGDCVWSHGFQGGGMSPIGDISNLGPLSFAKDSLGNVQMRGAATAEDGGGGDGVCNPSDPDEVEDAIAFTLPVGYRPEHTYVNFGGLVLPSAGANVEGQALPGGSVVGGFLGSGAGVLMDTTLYRAAAN
ncbi:MAG TPA: hypothetical protein VHF58_11375 [Solirubrobacterales bacterium]|nr:hypothetical protein [Solirubrobacterales bacterium]